MSMNRRAFLIRASALVAAAALPKTVLGKANTKATVRRIAEETTTNLGAIKYELIRRPDYGRDVWMGWWSMRYINSDYDFTMLFDSRAAAENSKNADYAKRVFAKVISGEPPDVQVIELPEDSPIMATYGF